MPAMRSNPGHVGRGMPVQSTKNQSCCHVPSVVPHVATKNQGLSPWPTEHTELYALMLPEMAAIQTLSPSLGISSEDAPGGQLDIGHRYLTKPFEPFHWKQRATAAKACQSHEPYDLQLWRNKTVSVHPTDKESRHVALQKCIKSHGFFYLKSAASESRACCV